ncbi:MFS transporter, partial [Klebsiella pneumoniae]|nr:MFS transporter [Klebsiella pneumoniae]
MIAVTLFNIGVQLSTPRWVAGRALAAYQAAIAGGVAIGSWLWGYVANGVGVDKALMIAGAVMFVSPI